MSVDLDLFSPSASRHYAELEQNPDLKLVHYTSATAASSIIRSKRFWLRNARLMNDYDELLTGARWLTEFWSNPSSLVHNQLFQLMNLKGADTANQVLEACFGAFDEIINETYIGCFSVHNDENRAVGDLGRLSMWRGYGSKESVALVLNTDRFLASDSPYNVFSYPVLYGNKEKHLYLIEEFTQNLKGNSASLLKMNAEDFVHVFRLFAEHMVLGFKHEGFSEENEWRVVYRPYDRASEQLERRYEEISGQMQAVYMLPLEDRFEGAEASFEIKNLTHKILIGPCPNQRYLQRLFVELLQNAGMSDAQQRVVTSRIPYRG